MRTNYQGQRIHLSASTGRRHDRSRNVHNSFKETLDHGAPMVWTPPSRRGLPSSGSCIEGEIVMQIVRIGLDLARYVFEIYGVDAHGKTVVRKTLRTGPHSWDQGSLNLRCNLACRCPSRIKPLLAGSAVGMWATRLRCPSEAAYPQPSPPPRFCPCRRATPPSASGCSSPGEGAENCRSSSRN